MESADGVYSHKPWGAPKSPPRWSYVGPFASNEERLTQQALAVGDMTHDEVLQSVKPTLSQIRLLPNRFGYDRTQPSIEDILFLDRNTVQPRIAWYSGSPAGYSGTSRNALG